MNDQDHAREPFVRTERNSENPRNPDGHVVVQETAVMRYTYLAPNSLSGRMQSAPKYDEDAIESETHYKCLCGEQFGLGDDAKHRAREHLNSVTVENPE